jgi:hypothetical protein
METLVFLALVVVVFVVMLARNRRGGIDDYVPGSEHRDPRMIADETNLRLAQYPGPGGPIDGTGGNVSGGS